MQSTVPGLNHQHNLYIIRNIAMNKIIVPPIILAMFYFSGSASISNVNLIAREDKIVISVTNFDDQSVSTTM